MAESIDVRGSKRIDWMYPNIYGPPLEGQPRDILNIALMHVRAACDIEIEYDSDRDGWAIYRTVDVSYTEVDGIWQPNTERREKAFIPAWEEDHKDAMELINQ